MYGGVLGSMKPDAAARLQVQTHFWFYSMWETSAQKCIHTYGTVHVHTFRPQKIESQFSFSFV